MGITDLSVRNSTTVIVLMIILVVVGLYAYLVMPREASPDIAIPYVLISTRYEGVAPSDMESLVTRPIERKLKGLSKIKEIQSVSTEGHSMIRAEFEIGENIDTVLQQVKDKVDLAKSDLPADAEDPSVSEINVSEFPIMFVTISGDVGLVKLKKIAEDLEDKFETVRGVLDAQIVGGLEREIHVEFNPDRLAAYKLSANEVIVQMMANNLNTPGGNIKIGEAKYTVKIPGEFESPAEIPRIVITVQSGNPIYLTDVATVVDSYKDQESYARIDSRDAVTVAVVKRSGENIISMADEIKKILAEHPFPPSVQVAITSDQSKFIRNMVSDLENNILTGLFLVLAVILLTLDLRSSIFISLAVPFSMLITFAVLHGMGITLNFIVLFSLILVLGMLVDNAIVLVENVYRHFLMGKSRVEAAMVGAREMVWPIAGSTLTTVVAFIPLLFWPGVMGKFMSYLPITLIIGLMASMLVAFVINPSLCSKFMGRPPVGDKTITLETRLRNSRVLRIYRGFLAGSLRFKYLVLLMAFGVLAGTIALYVQYGQGVIFFPTTEPNRAFLDMKAPEGTRLEKTDALVRPIEKLLATYPDVEHFTTNVGSHGAGNPLEGSGGSQSNIARIIVDFRDAEERTTNSSWVLDDVRHKLASFVGADIRIQEEQHGPPVGADVNVEVSGDDYSVLARLSDQVKSAVKDIPGVTDLDDDYVVGRPEIKVQIDKVRAALNNLNVAEIANFVRTAFNGWKVGVYREGEDEYDIIVRLPDSMRTSMADLRRLNISTRTGAQVPLTSVADLRTTSGLASVRRIDQKRVVSVTGKAIPSGKRTKQVIRDDVTAATRKAVVFPEGYKFTLTGEQKEQDEAQAFLSKAFVVALLLIALVIVIEFDSVVNTFIIMTSVILSLIGVLWGLLLTHSPFSVIMTGLGVISLAGVVVNNAIVLLDYVQQVRSRGVPMYDALVEAGLTRFRPVFLTAITTLLGLVPMAVGVSVDFINMKLIIGGESVEWWRPMAIAVIFGLGIATVLTLVVVPTVYAILHGLPETARWWWAGIKDTPRFIGRIIFGAPPIRPRPVWRPEESDDEPQEGK
jgi:CzcA family heavy metal efflux pump